jgi:Domain of unknown function (DUF4352)
MRASQLIALAIAASLVSCTSSGKLDAPHVYQVGDSVALGHLVYTVLEKQWYPQFGSGPAARVPQNRFYAVRISVLNRGDGESIVPQTELVDDAGANYPEATDGEGLRDWIGNTRQANPAASTQGYVLFDVQPKHYKLQVSGEDGKASALVDLPLTFDSDVPDVTTPLDPDKIPVKK